MSHKHKAKIEKLFEHPISGNIDAKRLFSALEHYGMSVDVTKHNKAKLTYNDEEFVAVLSHGNDLSKDAIVSIKHFLEKVGLVPGNL